MSSSSQSILPVDTIPTGTQRYQQRCTRAKIDLLIKRLALTTITLINIGALGVLFYYLVQTCAIPAKPIFTSTFLVGVLGALTRLKLPTFGITHLNYTSYTNPTSLIGRLSAYVLFGPILLMQNYLDLNNYADPLIANQISEELQECSFKVVAKQYKRGFRNLAKYGFINKTHASKIQDIFKKYIPKEKTLKDLEKRTKNIEKATKKKTSENEKPLLEQTMRVKKELKNLENQWRTLQSEIITYGLPRPNFSPPDYTQWRQRFVTRLSKLKTLLI